MDTLHSRLRGAREGLGEVHVVREPCYKDLQQGGESFVSLTWPPHPYLLLSIALLRTSDFGDLGFRFVFRFRIERWHMPRRCEVHSHDRPRDSHETCSPQQVVHVMAVLARKLFSRVIIVASMEMISKAKSLLA